MNVSHLLTVYPGAGFRLLTFILLSLCSGVIHAEVPLDLQAKVLALDPDVDKDGDQFVSNEELIKAYPTASKKLKKLIQAGIPGLSGDLNDDLITKAYLENSFKFDRPAGDPTRARKEGYNCLFMGHSYFLPFVKILTNHTQQLGLTQHQQFRIAAGGPAGSPGAIWKNEALSAPAKALLKRGNVELLCMTSHYSGSRLEDYSRWIDLALKHNPRTVFVIQTPWDMRKNRTLTEYAEAIEMTKKKSQQLFQQLRNKYPGTVFLNIPQGQWMLELWRLVEDGKLPEITNITAPKKQSADNALFRDNHGHAGTLAVDEGVLMWLHVIYGIDLNTYDHQSMTQYDLKALAQKICQEEPNTQYPE